MLHVSEASGCHGGLSRLRRCSISRQIAATPEHPARPDLLEGCERGHIRPVEGARTEIVWQQLHDKIGLVAAQLAGSQNAVDRLVVADLKPMKTFRAVMKSNWIGPFENEAFETQIVACIASEPPRRARDQERVVEQTSESGV